MAEENVIRADENDASGSDVMRVYEVGYHIMPTVHEEDLDTIVGSIRSHIEKASGSFIAEGAPVLTRLSYSIEVQEHGKNTEYDRGYFGWIKFEAPAESASVLERALAVDPQILRAIVFRTVREETRARIKMQTLREVRRTDSIKSTPRRAEEAAAPVSEEDLDKALETLTTD